MNKIIISGRLCADLQLQHTSAGMAYTRGTLAVSRKKKKETDFIDFTIWNRLAETVHKYASGKGTLLNLSGSLQTSSYDRQGIKIKAYSVIVDDVDFIDTVRSVEAQKPVYNEENKPEPIDIDVDVENPFEL